MIKKILLIVLGSLFAVAALFAVNVFYVRGPFVGFAGSRTAGYRSQAVRGRR